MPSLSIPTIIAGREKIGLSLWVKKLTYPLDLKIFNINLHPGTKIQIKKLE